MVIELCAFANVDLQNYSQSNFINHGTNYLACLKYPSDWNNTSLPCPALSVLCEPVAVVCSKNELQPASLFRLSTDDSSATNREKNRRLHRETYAHGARIESFPVRSHLLLAVVDDIILQRFVIHD